MDLAPRNTPPGGSIILLCTYEILNLLLTPLTCVQLIVVILCDVTPAIRSQPRRWEDPGPGACV